MLSQIIRMDDAVMMKKKTVKTACTQKVIQVQPQDLPISCPTDDMSVWNAHPKVYLPIETTGKETCPYCGTQFILQDV